jgi:hypothetical protein
MLSFGTKNIHLEEGKPALLISAYLPQDFAVGVNGVEGNLTAWMMPKFVKGIFWKRPMFFAVVLVSYTHTFPSVTMGECLY